MDGLDGRVRDRDGHNDYANEETRRRMDRRGAEGDERQDYNN